MLVPVTHMIPDTYRVCRFLTPQPHASQNSSKSSKIRSMENRIPFHRHCILTPSIHSISPHTSFFPLTMILVGLTTFFILLKKTNAKEEEPLAKDFDRIDQLAKTLGIDLPSKNPGETFVSWYKRCENSALLKF